MNTKYKSYLTAIVSIVLLVALDQWTKLLTIRHLKDQPAIPLIDGVLELQYLENRGAAFGMMQGQQVFFVIITVVLLGLIAFYYTRIPYGKRYLPIRILMVAVVAGAIGNFIDRCRFNYVVDMIYFKLIDFPIFNVADCYVTGSVFVFAALILWYYKEEELDFLFHPFQKRG